MSIEIDTLYSLVADQIRDELGPGYTDYTVNEYMYRLAEKLAAMALEDGNGKD